MSYIFEKTTDFDNIFGEDPDRLQVFFAHIFKSIGPILKKLRAKMCFFTFSKMVKNTTMTRKNHLPKHWCYEFFFFNLWIRVQILDSYFFRYSKRDLEQN